LTTRDDGVSVAMPQRGLHDMRTAWRVEGLMDYFQVVACRRPASKLATGVDAGAIAVRSVEEATKRGPQLGLGVIVRGATQNGRASGGHAQHGP
jgi:hypothetical protein